MGNNTVKFKNLYIPDTSLFQQENKTLNSNKTSKITIKYGKDLSDADLSKFKYQTFSLKTMKQVTFKQTQVIREITQLKILTYNIWFENQNAQIRANGLIEIIKQSNADIICLQEVTQQFMQLLWSRAAYLCQNGDYYLPRIPMHWYDTMILSRVPGQYYQIKFQETTMQRKLLMGLFQMKDQTGQTVKFSINCLHLQSLNNQKLRISQLQQVTSVNKNTDVVCICGDLNFGDNWAEDKICQSGYIDLWKLKKSPQEEKWTMPKTKQFSEWRPDHILLRNNKIGNQKFIKILEGKIQRVGKFTIPPFENDKVEDILKDKVVRTPSDHLGLIACIRF